MDDDTTLIEQLLSTAGAIMEDTSAVLVLVRERSLEERIEVAQSAARQIVAIVEAADVICHLRGS